MTYNLRSTVPEHSFSRAWSGSVRELFYYTVPTVKITRSALNHLSASKWSSLNGSVGIAWSGLSDDWISRGNQYMSTKKTGGGGDRKQETWDMRQETGAWRQETWEECFFSSVVVSQDTRYQFLQDPPISASKCQNCLFGGIPNHRRRSC